MRKKSLLARAGVAALAFCIPLLVGCTAEADQQRLDPTPKPYVETDLDRKVDAATDAYDDCMAQEGWIGQEVPAVNDPSETGIGYSYTEEQAPKFQASNAACIDESGLATVIPPRTDADMRAGYKSVLNMRECLTVAGYDIPEAPSLQSYLDGDGVWTPYEYISGMDDFRAAELACPQNGF